MYGNILKLVKKKLDDTPVTDSNRVQHRFFSFFDKQKKLLDTQLEVVKAQGWTHIEKQLQNQRLHLYPTQLPPLL